MPELDVALSTTRDLLEVVALVREELGVQLERDGDGYGGEVDGVRVGVFVNDYENDGSLRWEEFSHVVDFEPQPDLRLEENERASMRLARSLFEGLKRRGIRAMLVESLVDRLDEFAPDA